MTIRIPRANCSWLDGISHYNNNYYELPFSVNDLDILYEYYDSAEEFCGNQLGEIIDNKFVPKYWLHQYDDDTYFLIDSETIKDHNEWT